MDKEERRDIDMNNRIDRICKQLERMFMSFRGLQMKKEHLKKIYGMWMMEFAPFCMHLSKDDIKEIFSDR